MIDCRGRLDLRRQGEEPPTRLLSYFRENSRDPEGRQDHPAHARARLGTDRRRIRGTPTRTRTHPDTSSEVQRPRRTGTSAPPLPLPRQVAGTVCLCHEHAPTGKELGVYGPLVAAGQLGGCRPPAQRLVQAPRLPANGRSGIRRSAASLFPKIGRRNACASNSEPAAGRASPPARARSTAPAFARRRRSSMAATARFWRSSRQLMEAAGGVVSSSRRRWLCATGCSRLEWIDARLALLRQARTQNSFVYPLDGPRRTRCGGT